MFWIPSICLWQMEASRFIKQCENFCFCFVSPPAPIIIFQTGGGEKLTCVRSPCQLGNDDAFDWRQKNLQHIVIKQTEKIFGLSFCTQCMCACVPQSFVHGHEKPSPPHFYTEGNFCFIIPNFSCAGKQVMHFFFLGTHYNKTAGLYKKGKKA